MDQYHKPHTKKVSAGSGGRRRKFRDKKLCHVGGVFASTKLGEKNVRQLKRGRGGSVKAVLKKAHTVNVVTKEGVKQAEILNVSGSHDPEFIRMNIITRGAVLETKLGKVRVTNRVGQDGVVNGVLI